MPNTTPDFYIKAGGANLQFVGASEEVHVHFDFDVPDEDCLAFIAALRADFGRVSQDKGRFAGTLEKWNIFPNQFLTIASRCGGALPACPSVAPCCPMTGQRCRHRQSPRAASH